MAATHAPANSRDGKYWDRRPRDSEPGFESYPDNLLNHQADAEDRIENDLDGLGKMLFRPANLHVVTYPFVHLHPDTQQ